MLPMPDAAVTASGVALTLGGASLMLGVKPALGAAAVAGFLAGVSPSCTISGKFRIPKNGKAK